jgi:excisionase family DNA binding protein
VSAEGTEYLRPSEAAQLLHVSIKSLNRWADEGRVRCITTLGGHRRFPRDEIDAVALRMAGSERAPARED